MDFHTLDRRHGRRYLSVRGFMDFCCSVGVHITEQTELEFYEEHRLLLPAARIIKPDDYLRSIAGEHDVPDRYAALHPLLTQIHFPSPIEQRPDQSLTHPIDEAFGRVPELFDPRQTPFYPWDSHVEVFYHYCQVYELYQIRRDKGMYADTGCVVRYEGEWHYTPRHTIESTLLWKRPVAEGDCLGLHDDFDMLSEFIYLYNQEHRRAFTLVDLDEDLVKVLPPEDYKQYRSRVVNIANDISQQYGLDQDRLYAFLRKLMEMHYSYRKAEKSKLADSIKRDIGFLMRMIAGITGQDSAYIAEKAGSLRRHLSGPSYLEIIFPNARAKARDSAVKVLKQWAKHHYNPYVTAPFAMDNTSLDALVGYIENTDLAIFEYALFILNETWWDTPVSTQLAAMYFCIRNLAAFPEAFLRRLYDKRKGSGTSPGQLKGYTLLPYARALIKNESALSQLYDILRRHGRLSRAETPEEFERNFECLRCKMDSSIRNDQGYLAYCHLMAALVRNFTHHHPVAQDSSLFDNRYLRAIRAILSVVFFAWIYACRQGWIGWLRALRILPSGTASDEACK